MLRVLEDLTLMSREARLGCTARFMLSTAWSTSATNVAHVEPARQHPLSMSREARRPRIASSMLTTAWSISTKTRFSHSTSKMKLSSNVKGSEMSPYSMKHAEHSTVDVTTSRVTHMLSARRKLNSVSSVSMQQRIIINAPSRPRWMFMTGVSRVTLERPKPRGV